MTRVLLVTALILCAFPGAFAAPPPGKAVGVGVGSGEWDGANRSCPFVMYDDADKAYRIYYTGSSRHQTNESAWEQWMIGLAVSKDASSWSAEGRMLPVLEPHRYMQGDILNPDDTAAEFDSIYATGPCVIRDGGLCKMWYTGWGGEAEHVGGGVENKVNLRIGYADSKDGVRWTKRPGSAGAGSVLGLGSPGRPDSRGVGQPFVLKERATYRMWYEGFDGRVWRILYATSNNGLTWTRNGVALDIGERKALDQLGLRSPIVIKRDGRYELWYTGQSVTAPADHLMRATSPDGITWTKVPGEIALHPDPPVNGDERMHVDSVIVLPDNSCQVFFDRETTTTGTVSDGLTSIKRYAIYTEVVNGR